MLYGEKKRLSLLSLASWLYRSSAKALLPSTTLATSAKSAGGGLEIADFAQPTRLNIKTANARDMKYLPKSNQPASSFGIGQAPHEQDTAAGVVPDQKEERMIGAEGDLVLQGIPEKHGSSCGGSFSAGLLNIHE